MTAKETVSKILAEWASEEARPENVYWYTSDSDCFIWRNWRTENVTNTIMVGIFSTAQDALSACKMLNLEFVAIAEMLKKKGF